MINQVINSIMWEGSLQELAFELVCSVDTRSYLSQFIDIFKLYSDLSLALSWEMVGNNDCIFYILIMWVLYRPNACTDFKIHCQDLCTSRGTQAR